jgi:hypothetical protein
MILPTVLLFVEFNTTMALAILNEQRGFVGAVAGPSCGCEAAQGDQQCILFSSADTVYDLTGRNRKRTR